MGSHIPDDAADGWQGVTAAQLFIWRAIGMAIQSAVIGSAGAAVAEFVTSAHRFESIFSHPNE